MEPDKFVKKTNYVDFIDRYTSRDALGLDGNMAYLLRCGMVHRGNASGNPFFGNSNVIFTLPGGRVSFHGPTIGFEEGLSAKMLDLSAFCAEMMSAVERWYLDNQKHPALAKNEANLLTYRPAGAPPFLLGFPVLASGPLGSKGDGAALNFNIR